MEFRLHLNQYSTMDRGTFDPSFSMHVQTNNVTAISKKRIIEINKGGAFEFQTVV